MTPFTPNPPRTRPPPQAGFALIPALFLIVVLGALALVAIRVGTGQQQTVIMALQETRALAAARPASSGAPTRAQSGSCAASTNADADRGRAQRLYGRRELRRDHLRERRRDQHFLCTQVRPRPPARTASPATCIASSAARSRMRPDAMSTLLIGNPDSRSRRAGPGARERAASRCSYWRTSYSRTPLSRNRLRPIDRLVRDDGRDDRHLHARSRPTRRWATPSWCSSGRGPRIPRPAITVTDSAGNTYTSNALATSSNRHGTRARRCSRRRSRVRERASQSPSRMPGNDSASQSRVGRARVFRASARSTSSLP